MSSRSSSCCCIVSCCKRRTPPKSRSAVSAVSRAGPLVEPFSRRDALQPGMAAGHWPFAEASSKLALLRAWEANAGCLCWYERGAAAMPCSQACCCSAQSAAVHLFAPYLGCLPWDCLPVLVLAIPFEREEHHLPSIPESCDQVTSPVLLLLRAAEEKTSALGPSRMPTPSWPKRHRAALLRPTSTGGHSHACALWCIQHLCQAVQLRVELPQLSACQGCHP